MADDNPFSKMRIPTAIRAMLDPFRVVLANPDQPFEAPKDFEVSYISKSSALTPEQLQAFGRVATTFSVLERVFSLILGRLALAPDFPALAITKDLSMDNHVKALKLLLDLHAERFSRTIVSEDVERILTNMAAEFAPLKDERNAIVHSVWMRFNDDEVIALNARPRTAAKATKYPMPKKTVTELNKLADKIQHLADAMFIIFQTLPEVDEGPHVRSLSQQERPRLPEIRTKPEGPPEPSRA